MSKITGYNELKKAIKTNSRYEWEIAINTNNQRGKVYGQEELLKMFPANGGDASGASKTCYILDMIVIKRQSNNYRNCFGNQVAQEIEAFINASDELKNVFCPILSYYKCKSDKVTSDSQKAMNKYVVISQKATDIDDFYNCCEIAFNKNIQEGHKNRYNSPDEMYNRLSDILTDNDIHDWDGHPYNSGVIFDYEKKCYKPVLIDYGL